MTTEKLMNIINATAGTIGVHNYESYTKEQFLKWFKCYYPQAKEVIDFLENNDIMTYGDFNCKYNKRDYRGVIIKTSIIDMDGNILYHDEFDKVFDYWDNNIECVWENHKLVGYKINDKFVDTTNYGHTDMAAKNFFSKLNFKVL